eukprot:g4339.t1
MFLAALALGGLLACAATAAPTYWTDAPTMRADVERLVLDRAKTLQSFYSAVLDAEGAVCPFIESCDPGRTKHPAAWAAATPSPPAFLTAANDPADPSTCFRRDRNADAQHVEPVTGRYLCNGANGQPPGDASACADSKCAGWSKTTCDFASGHCVKNHADGLIGQRTGSVGQGRFFLNAGCTQNQTAADKGKCTVNQEEYGINLPDGLTVENATARMHAEICATNQLVRSYKQNLVDFPQLAWSFLGMQHSGLYRNWPLIYQCRTEAQCPGCSDPRFRSWYADAASLPKDVIILIDSSGSMDEEVRPGRKRLDAAMDAADWVISTLSWVDHASVISFDSTARTVGPTDSELLLPMTLEGRTLLKRYLRRDLQAFGGTKMDVGLAKAFDTLERSRAAGKSSSCASVVVFLADGANTGEDPLPIIRAWNDGRAMPTRIFSYNFLSEGGGLNPTLKQAACASGGIYQDVNDEGLLKKAMANYFSFLAVGLVPGDGKSQAVRWTETYEDGQGIGQNTAACAPVYDLSASPPDLFAVVCSAVKDGDLRNLAGWDAEWAAIRNASAQCPSLELTEPQLEKIRTAVGPASSCAGGTNSDHADAQQSALSFPVAASVVLAVLGGVVVTLVAGFIFLRMCGRGTKSTHGAEGGNSTGATRSVGLLQRQGTLSSFLPPRAAPYAVKRRHAAFLSHFKAECAMEARFLHEQLMHALGCEKVFIDSDDLKDLRQLLEHVAESDHLLLIQSKGLLTRPWCLLEIYAAIRAKVPIVTINVRGANAYDFADGVKMLTHLDTMLDERNPGASAVLAASQVDIVDCAWKLSVVIPQIISVEFNPSASKNIIAASIQDIVDAMSKAQPADDPSFAQPGAKEAWLARRPPRSEPPSGCEKLAEHGKQLIP